MPKSKVRKKAKAKRRRPTPPEHQSAQAVREKGESPRWYVALMFGFMGVGGLVIILNYIGVMPGGTSNTWLIVGLLGIAIGFTMTLNYR